MWPNFLPRSLLFWRWFCCWKGQEGSISSVCWLCLPFAFLPRRKSGSMHILSPSQFLPSQTLWACDGQHWIFLMSNCALDSIAVMMFLLFFFSNVIQEYFLMLFKQHANKTCFAGERYGQPGRVAGWRALCVQLTI